MIHFKYIINIKCSKSNKPIQIQIKEILYDVSLLKYVIIYYYSQLLIFYFNNIINLKHVYIYIYIYIIYILYI